MCHILGHVCTHIQPADASDHSIPILTSLWLACQSESEDEHLHALMHVHIMLSD